MIHFAASIPGRLRLRGGALHSAPKLKQLQARLAELEAVTRVRSNPKAASIVIHYDRHSVSRAAMERAVGATIAAAHSPTEATAVPHAPPRRRKKARPARIVANRYAKVVMLASLATALAVAELRLPRWRYWHATTGWLFVAALGVHLFAYRRHLLR